MLPNGIGQVNQAGINYYKNLITALKAANIQPMVLITNILKNDFKLKFPFLKIGDIVSLGFASSAGESRRVAQSSNR